MRKLSCPYETASNGQEAIDVYRTADGAFDLIFMDIQMPKKDGMAASAEIRIFEMGMSLERTTIIAITGLSSLEAQQRASKYGIDSFLTKPVSLKILKTITDENSKP
jgi:CheY-like chemotaxis protein